MELALTRPRVSNLQQIPFDGFNLLFRRVELLLYSVKRWEIPTLFVSDKPLRS